MADASSMVGMKGISMVSTLDGRWVNTIVLIRPILLAIHLLTKESSNFCHDQIWVYIETCWEPPEAYRSCAQPVTV